MGMGMSSSSLRDLEDNQVRYRTNDEPQLENIKRKEMTKKIMEAIPAVSEKIDKGGGKGAGEAVISLASLIGLFQSCVDDQSTAAHCIKCIQLKGKPADGCVKISGTYDVVVFNEGVQTIQLLGKGIVLQHFTASRDPNDDFEPIPTVLNNGSLGVMVGGRGNYSFTMDMLVAYSSASESGFVFQLPETRSTSVDFVVEQTNIEVQVEPCHCKEVEEVEKKKESEDFVEVSGQDDSHFTFGTRVVANLPPTRNVSVNWMEVIEDAEENDVLDLPLVVTAEQHTLYSIGDEFIMGTTTLNYEINNGAINKLRVWIDSRARVASVEGNALKSWSIVQPNELGDEDDLEIVKGMYLVKVFLEYGQEESYQLEIATELDTESVAEVGTSGSSTPGPSVPEGTTTSIVSHIRIQCADVSREKGFCAVEATANVEVDEAKISNMDKTTVARGIEAGKIVLSLPGDGDGDGGEGSDSESIASEPSSEAGAGGGEVGGVDEVVRGGNISIVDVGDIPEALKRNATAPILLAYKFLHPDFTLNFSITKHADVDVLSALVEACLVKICVTEEGMELVKVVAEVRNTHQQYLRLIPPEDVEIWSAAVDGRAVKPTSDGEEILLPMEKVESAGGQSKKFAVELTYVLQTDPMTDQGEGTLAFLLPRVDLPVAHLFVECQLPSTYRYGEFSGNLREVESWTRTPPTERQPSQGKNQRLNNQNTMRKSKNKASKDGFGTGKLQSEKEQRQTVMHKGLMPVHVQTPSMMQTQTFRFEQLLVTNGCLYTEVPFKVVPKSYWSKRKLGLVC